MTPTQADYEVSDEAVRLLFDGSIKGADLRETIVKHIASYRLAAEAAAFEKAAGVVKECVVQQARDVAIRPASPQSPGEWRDAVREAAIRKLAGEKHD